MDSFYSRDELEQMGFKALGEDVRLSRKSSVYAPERISFGNHVRIDDFTFLSGDITLGSHIHIAPFCSLIGGTGEAGIVMEDYSGLSGHVMIYSISDDYSGNFLTNPTIPAEYTHVEKGRIVLGRFVIIGTLSVILPGITVGEGSAIGAMSLVTRDMPEWKICAGVPARPLKDRSRKLLELEHRFTQERASAIII